MKFGLTFFRAGFKEMPDAFDLGIAIALTFVAVSNPVGLIAIGVYGFLDASGALDDIKESLGSEVVILKRNTG